MILNGKPVFAEMKETIRNLINQTQEQVRLAAVVVGDNPASKIYVKNKEKDCIECDICMVTFPVEETVSESVLLELIRALSNDPQVHGIMVQMPLPKHIDSHKIMEAIHPTKDVDCFHPRNVGLLSQGKAVFEPCTPAGIMKLFSYYGILVSSKHCVMIGRSEIVGKPMSMMLLNQNATVTTCHTRTRNLEDICKTADILISAVGKQNFITHKHVKPGAIVVDVGINRDENGKVCGDVHPEVYDITSAYTPVPGGVGLMTRGMLLHNVMKASVLCGGQ